MGESAPGRQKVTVLETRSHTSTAWAFNAARLSLSPLPTQTVRIRRPIQIGLGPRERGGSVTVAQEASFGHGCPRAQAAVFRRASAAGALAGQGGVASAVVHVRVQRHWLLRASALRLGEGEGESWDETYSGLPSLPLRDYGGKNGNGNGNGNGTSGEGSQQERRGDIRKAIRGTRRFFPKCTGDEEGGHGGGGRNLIGGRRISEEVGGRH